MPPTRSYLGAAEWARVTARINQNQSHSHWGKNGKRTPFGNLGGNINVSLANGHGNANGFANGSVNENEHAHTNDNNSMRPSSIAYPFTRQQRGIAPNAYPNPPPTVIWNTDEPTSPLEAIESPLLPFHTSSSNSRRQEEEVDAMRVDTPSLPPPAIPTITTFAPAHPPGFTVPSGVPVADTTSTSNSDENENVNDNEANASPPPFLTPLPIPLLPVASQSRTPPSTPPPSPFPAPTSQSNGINSTDGAVDSHRSDTALDPTPNEIFISDAENKALNALRKQFKPEFEFKTYVDDAKFVRKKPKYVLPDSPAWQRKHQHQHTNGSGVASSSSLYSTSPSTSTNDNVNPPFTMPTLPHFAAPTIGNLLLSSCPGKKVRLKGPVKGRGSICRDLGTDLERIAAMGVRCIVWYVHLIFL